MLISLLWQYAWTVISFFYRYFRWLYIAFVNAALALLLEDRLHTH